jgi:serine/threonine-protein kinase HipA
MNRAVKVYIKGKYAGILEETDDEHYSFRYDDAYYADPDAPPVSLTMPKDKQEYLSPFLFPVFFNMTSEGDNRMIQSRQLHIDERDDFGILSATAHTDTIGAITVKPVIYD